VSTSPLASAVVRHHCPNRLRGEVVEGALTVVGVTLRPILDTLGIRPASVEVTLVSEPLTAAAVARSGGRLDLAHLGT
jgi:hypothetical protein